MPEPTQSKQATVVNADDAWLDAKARFEQWQQEFNIAWYKPQVDTAMKFLWQKQPEEVKNYIRQSKPEAAKKIDTMLKEV